MENLALPRLTPDAARLADEALSFLDRVFSFREHATPTDPHRDHAQRMALAFLRAALATATPVACGETATRYMSLRPTRRAPHLSIVE